MTTPLVPSITDEQLAELVRECRTGADEHGGMGNEYDSGLFDRLGDALEHMQARLRAAEADAKRLQYAIDHGALTISMGGYESERAAIDAAMERTP